MGAWHNSTDPAVLAENTMLYARALSEHLIPYELHIYPYGDHDLALQMAMHVCMNGAMHWSVG